MTASLENREKQYATLADVWRNDPSSITTPDLARLLGHARDHTNYKMVDDVTTEIIGRLTCTEVVLNETQARVVVGSIEFITRDPAAMTHYYSIGRLSNGVTADRVPLIYDQVRGVVNERFGVR